MEREYVDIGVRNAWGGELPLRLFSEDRQRHMFLVGQTGTGKSTLLKTIFTQDVASGTGCALIDPHGDLALEVLGEIPGHRIDDVAVLDPSDTERPVAFNPFYRVPKDEQSLVASNITATFKHIWHASWGPRLEYILFNAVAALVAAPDHLRPSFLAIPLLLVRKDYRDRVVSCVEDAVVRRFFVEEFDRWNDRQRAEYLGAVQNKIGQFLASPFVRNVIGQWKPTIDINEILATSKVLIVRLPKGVLGEEPANLLGSLIVSGFQQAAMRRAAVPEQDRHDFHLHIDEFTNFTTSAFAGMLSEIRKYGLSVCPTSQFLDQIPTDVLSALLGNVGTLIVFRVSASDAETLAKELGGYPPHTLRELGLGEMCVRLPAGQAASDFVLGRTLHDPSKSSGDVRNVLHQSRMRYGRSRAVVEARMQRWLH